MGFCNVVMVVGANILLLLLGVEPGQLQAEDQPHRSHRLPEHGHRFPRRLPVCFRWKGTIKTQLLLLLLLGWLLPGHRLVSSVQVRVVMENILMLSVFNDDKEAVSELYLHP